MKFSEVLGVTNFKPFFLGKKREKICHQKSTGFFTLGGGGKNAKFHHLDLLGAALRNISSLRDHTSDSFHSSFFRESETTIKKMCAFQGGGVSRGAGRKIVQNAIFHGKRRDNKILKVKILLSRHFVVMAQASICISLQLCDDEMKDPLATPHR